jgi:hypothetical protein
LHAAAFFVSSAKLPNLELKARPKQLLGYLPLNVALLGSSKLKIVCFIFGKDFAISLSPSASGKF